MVQFCVMVKGPCRGKSCDFWARIRIRKIPTEDLAAKIKSTLSDCKEIDSRSLDDAICEFWLQMGILNLERLCDEDPDLCAKMAEGKALVQH